MAMDKEKLLAYFETQYLSRREILFKLPLNISIDNFWPVLLNRRKAKATLLPLQNAAGMPYWYVLTDRMIAASERLCEEAIRKDSAFDPYRAGMTSAMTEEMFFTSFVEGAQIPLQEAMDFLQRGTEPESIQEQMIWNNRRAWAEMSGTLYRPLDENFVRSLAFMLTEEMDNCAEDYRQTDQHAIAAMENEEYVVSSAFSLPDRMREYYKYLQKPDEHPLIKAAVAQAYLLVTRPFPEGNERLSRMMSSAVLLRCGYDFFRDISISSVIARESYLYYKCMCEIIRSENGGDLTYFLQYYLELLARSLDARDERLRRLEQEALDREREKALQEEALARQPLRQTATEAAASGPGDADSDYTDQALTPVSSEKEKESDKSISGEATEIIADETQKDSGSSAEEIIQRALQKMSISKSSHIRLLASTIQEMRANEIKTFTTKDWEERLGESTGRAQKDCKHLRLNGIIRNISTNRRYAVYAFADAPSTVGQIEYCERPSEAMIDELSLIVTDHEREHIGKISRLLLCLIDKEMYTFREEDVVNAFGMAKSTCNGLLRECVNLGFLRRNLNKAGSHNCRYYFNCDRVQGIRVDGLTKLQTEILTTLYNAFHDKEFTLNDGANVLGQQSSSLSFHITSFAQRAILNVRSRQGHADIFSFATTPKEHPECFAPKLKKKHDHPPTFELPAAIPLPTTV